MNRAATEPLARIPAAELGFLPQLQETVARRLEADGFSARARGRAELILEEIYVNVINYAYPDGPGEFELEYGCENGAAKLVFMDRGPRFNPLEHPDPDTSAPLQGRTIGGLGVMLLKRMASQVAHSYENGRNRLEIILKED